MNIGFKRQSLMRAIFSKSMLKNRGSRRNNWMSSSKKSRYNRSSSILSRTLNKIFK